MAFESSCDETGVAIYSTNGEILANEVFSQIPLHQQYGGVVPELAARDHLTRLPLLLKTALEKANLSLEDINYIAYTAYPGLLGTLMTGATFAKSLAYALKIPSLPVHHMEGHLLSPLLSKPKPQLPFLALLVSGGHTQILAVKEIGKYELLGQTLDDAAGEAFDKAAKTMGLSYPGGVKIARLAEKGDSEKYKMPQPMIKKDNLDFSFSGLKTHTRLLIEKEAKDEQSKADIAACLQKTIVETLAKKCLKALKKTGYKNLVVAGGVSANLYLRQKFAELAIQNKFALFFPELSLCGDNALMIAHAASYHLDKAECNNLTINVMARKAINEQR